VILVDTSGNNAISVAPGANLELTSRDAMLALAEELEGCSYIVCQLECPLELALGLADWAHEGGKAVVLNPAPARSIDIGDLHLFDVLTPNESELASLASDVGVEGASIETQALALVDCGVGTVVATLGGKGALRASKGGIESFPAYPVEVVDTTGAGDAFTAGFVAALAQGSTMDDAIDAGCRSGAFCVTRRGVIDGLATSAELEMVIPSRPGEVAEGS
jgi:ribokinase